jgi:hypothetical protein
MPTGVKGKIPCRPSTVFYFRRLFSYFQKLLQLHRNRIKNSKATIPTVFTVTVFNWDNTVFDLVFLVPENEASAQQPT